MLAYLTQGLLLGGTSGRQPAPFRHCYYPWRWKGFPPGGAATPRPLISDGPILLIVLLLLISYRTGCVWPLLEIGGGLFLMCLAWGAYRAVTSAEHG
ncbi:MAG: hypothetical protein R3C44_17175 [Chloroflexota bacterium]